MGPLGLDLSHWSGEVDFQVSVEAGIKFVFIKCTDGVDFHDPNYFYYLDNAGAVSLPRGSYHYYRADEDPEVQARWFSDHADLCEFPPIVDVEVPGVDADTLRHFLETVHGLRGVKPIIYTSLNKWRNVTPRGEDGRIPWASAYDLWIANYGVDLPAVPKDWYGEWSFWQFTDSAPGSDYGVYGNTADLNYFNGTTDQLSYYIKRAQSLCHLPRYEFKDPRVTKVIPHKDFAAFVMLEALDENAQVVWSYDHVTDGIVHVYGISEEDQQRYINWFERHYPDVIEVEFRDLPY